MSLLLLLLLKTAAAAAASAAFFLIVLKKDAGEGGVGSGGGRSAEPLLLMPLPLELESGRSSVSSVLLDDDDGAIEMRKKNSHDEAFSRAFFRFFSSRLQLG